VKERRRARGQGVLVGEMENSRHYELHEGDVVLVEQEAAGSSGMAWQHGKVATKAWQAAG
jgi:hypothetical protein